MTLTATPRRRASDLTGKQAAVLEGQINVLEEKIVNVDHKVDGLAGQMSALDSKVDALKDSMIAQQAERSAFLEAFKMVAEAQRQPAAQPDEFRQWRRRIFDLLQIAGAVVLLLAIVMFADRTLLSPQASKEAHELGGAIAH